MDKKKEYLKLLEKQINKNKQSDKVLTYAKNFTLPFFASLAALYLVSGFFPAFVYFITSITAYISKFSYFIYVLNCVLLLFPFFCYTLESHYSNYLKKYFYSFIR